MIPINDIAALEDVAAVDRLVDIEFDGDADAFILALSRTANRLLQTDLSEAGRFVGEAARVIRLLDPRYQPRALALEARYRHHTGDSTAALRLYRKAATLLWQHRDFPGLARLRLGLMDVYMYTGQYAQARTVGKKALAQFRRHGDRTNEAKALTNLGNVYHRLDRNRTALAYYNKARQIFAREGGVPLAITELNRANIMSNLNRLAEARRLYQRSAQLFDEQQVALSAAKVRYSIAYLHFLADEFTEAITLLEQLHDRLARLGDHKTAAVAHLDLAEINLHINQPGSSAILAEQLVPQFEEMGMRYERGKAAFFAGVAHGRLGNRRRAINWLTRAHQIFEQEHNKLWQGMVAFQRAQEARAGRRIADCLKHLQTARRLFRTADDRRRMIDVDLLRLDALLAGEQLSEASRLAQRLRRQKLVSYQSYSLHKTLGLHAQRGGHHRQAVTELQKAVGIVEKMIIGMCPDEIRSFFLIDKADVYLALIDSQLALGRVRDAFLQQLSALHTLNQPIPMERMSDAAVPPALLETRDSLRTQLRRLSIVAPTGSRRIDSLKNYRKLEHQLWSNEQRIRSYHSRPTGAGEMVRRDEFQPPDAGRTVVTFHDSPTQLGAFVSTADETRFVPFDMKRGDLAVMLREMQFVLERSVYARGSQMQQRTVDYYLRRIYDTAFAPLESQVDGREVHLVVDGLVSQIPFWALQDAEGHYLTERFDFRLLCNPADLPVIQANEAVDFPQRQNSVFGLSSTYLPSIAAEVAAIVEQFGTAQRFDETGATVEALRRAMSASDGFVHIATHASRSTENPLFSRMLMADGPLYPFDLFGAGIAARLVVLSGCQTAAPGLYSGNAFSLAKAFYLAGSQQVLATLWPVSDHVSLAFMTEFYTSLRDNGDVFAAYQQALRTTRRQVEHPALWAPFVLIG